MKTYVKKMLHATGISALVILAGYVTLHLASLTSLPIFADEAIYIRWTQLMIDDFTRYAFFPMNDGKTPLQFWLLIPWQFLPLDQLASARLFMIVVGLFQVLSMGWLAWICNGKRPAILMSMTMTAFLPYWYFHHGLFLLDGLLTLWLSLFLGFSIILFKHISAAKNNVSQPFFTFNMTSIQHFVCILFKEYKKIILLTLASGLAFGLALLTKVPAILAIPAIGISILYSSHNWWDRFLRSIFFGISLLIGTLMFASLSIHPAFGQLFSRGGDFLFPISAILVDQAWKETIPSIPNYLYTFFVYLTPTITILNVTSLFLKPNKKRSHVLFWSGIIFLLPIMIMGRVVYPRYLFPAALFFTLNAALCAETIMLQIKEKGLSIQRSLVALTMALLLANSAAASASFIYFSITDTSQLPLVSADKEQYLYEWSAGHGIKETVHIIRMFSQKERVAVATEGSFGTLPDGLMVYLHRTDVSNIFVDGIGFPLKEIPHTFIEKTLDFDRFILVGNSDRIKNSEIPLDSLTLIEEFCKPDNAPCLQVWDFTQLQETLGNSN